MRNIGDKIHRHLSGKRIEYVARNGELLVIRCTDGSEVRVKWVDVNGNAIKGEPAMAFLGLNIHAKTGTLFGRRETR